LGIIEIILMGLINHRLPISYVTFSLLSYRAGYIRENDI
jgi:hypothetical protein